MTKTKSLAQPAVFVPLVIVLLILVGVAGPKLRRKHFTYTATSDVGSTRSIFPIKRKLVLLKSDRVSGDVLLSDLVMKHPGGVILNFWATWCPPCIEELPSLEMLARQLDARHDVNLPTIVAVSVDEKPADVFGLLKTLDFHSSLQILHDKEGELARSVGTVRFPETYWIGADGQVLYKWVGPQNWVSTEVIERIASLSKTGKR